MNKSLQLLTLLLSLFILSCGDSAGIVDETDTEITAILKDTSGAILRNTTVLLYVKDDESGLYLDSTETDSTGSYTFIQESGKFAVWAETDTSAFFVDTVITGKGTRGYHSVDTLTPLRRIYVKVHLQPNHSPNILESQILGTYIGPSFNSDSYMILEDIPNGTYNIKITANKHEYSSLTPRITITEATGDTLSTEYTLPYYGIPIVTGVTTSYDTLSGKVTISWDKSSYEFADSYIIFRSPAGAPTDSLKEIGTTENITFTDSTFTADAPQGEYIYMVKIKHNNQVETGAYHHKDTINFVHPSKEFNIVSQTFDTLYLHYEETLDLNISKWFGEGVTTSYKLENMTDFVSLTDPEKLPLKVTDTYYDSLQCIIAVSGRDTTIYDTLHFAVVSRWNKSTDAFFTTGRVQKAVQFNDSYFTSVLNGNKQTIYTSLDGISWTLHCDSAVVTYDSSWASNLTVCMDKLWLLDGNSIFHSSTDGIIWIQESVTAIESPWGPADNENRTLANRGDSLEILFENSNSSSKLTQYTYFTYEPISKTLNSSYKYKNLYPSASWIEHSESNGFQIFVYEFKLNTKHEIMLYEMSNESISKVTSAPIRNGDTDYTSWEKTPQLTGIFCNGGLQLFNGWNASNDLFFRDASLWTKENNKEHVYDIIPTLEEMKNETNAVYVKTEKGLVLLSPRGIFTNY